MTTLRPFELRGLRLQRLTLTLNISIKPWQIEASYRIKFNWAHHGVVVIETRDAIVSSRVTGKVMNCSAAYTEMEVT